MRFNLSSETRDPLAVLRIRFIQVLATVCVLASVGGIAAQIVLGDLQLIGIFSTVSLIVVGVLALLLVQFQRVTLASMLLIAALIFSLWVVNILGALFIISTIVLLCGAALTSPVFYLVINFLVFGRLFIELFLLINRTGLRYTSDGGTLVSVISALVIISAATRFFIDTGEESARESGRSAELLRATAEIGQITAALTKMDEIFNRAVELVRDRFAFYHVQIFLVDDDRKFAKLVASTGEIGQKLLARNHRLAIGSQSVIGRVTQIGETVITRDTDSDSVHAVNELLPNTRSELALPIIDGERIIGALDVQSTRRDAFKPVDIQALQVMAAQLATVIRNARLFEQQETSVQQNQRLLLEARTNLREIQRLNSQLSKKAWDEYLNNTETTTGVKLEDNNFASEVEWTDDMVKAIDDQRPISRTEGNTHTTAVPITLRGEVLGAIEVSADDMREIELVEMVQAVAQNLAISLDGARLFEEAQENAAQEQRINAIVERYQSALTVDDLLKITVNELSQTLGSHQAAIRVGLSGQSTSTLSVVSDDDTPELNGSQTGNAGLSYPGNGNGNRSSQHE